MYRNKCTSYTFNHLLEAFIDTVAVDDCRIYECFSLYDRLIIDCASNEKRTV